MQVEIYENFKFSYVTDDGIQLGVTDIAVAYDGTIPKTVFKELFQTTIDGELNNLVFTDERYKYIDKLEELDNLGIINVALVNEIDDKFEFIVDGIEQELLNNLSDDSGDYLQIALFNTH